jgi:hypothetical protein
MKRTKRYDEGGGIPAQTEEEAANEMELNSPAARARRNVSDAENQIRADAVAKLANKVAPAIKMDNAPEIDTEGKRTSMAVGPAAKRTPMVTKEQLAASGLSLRDYLNKQQGLTCRDGAAPSATATSMPGGSLPPSRALMPNKEGQPGGSVRPRGTGTVMQQGRGTDIYGESIEDIKKALKKDPSKRSFWDANNERIANLKKGGAVKKMASGGSVSSASKRADGIAQRGKTKGKMC